MVRVLLVLTTAALLVGCNTGTSAPVVKVEHAELGRPFLLADEPAGAVGILDFREALPADEETTAQEITLLGRIGGGDPTWSSQSAAFLVSDPSHEIAADSQHVCTSDNCPFCKAKKSEDKSHAIVMLTDGDNRVPPHDARKLLPLEEGQMVVVRGRAEINALGQLIVHARSLYVRR